MYVSHIGMMAGVRGCVSIGCACVMYACMSSYQGCGNALSLRASPPPRANIKDATLSLTTDQTAYKDLLNDLKEGEGHISEIREQIKKLPKRDKNLERDQDRFLSDSMVTLEQAVYGNGDCELTEISAALRGLQLRREAYTKWKTTAEPISEALIAAVGLREDKERDAEKLRKKLLRNGEEGRKFVEESAGHNVLDKTILSRTGVEEDITRMAEVMLANENKSYEDIWDHTSRIRARLVQYWGKPELNENTFLTLYYHLPTLKKSPYLLDVQGSAKTIADASPNSPALEHLTQEQLDEWVYCAAPGQEDEIDGASSRPGAELSQKRTPTETDLQEAMDGLAQRFAKAFTALGEYQEG